MRLNGLSLALATLLAPACALAQAAPEPGASPEDAAMAQPAPAEAAVADDAAAGEGLGESVAAAEAPVVEPVAEDPSAAGTAADGAAAQPAVDGAPPAAETPGAPVAEADATATPGAGEPPTEPLPAPPPDKATADAPTEAERDFADIYGTQDYADPNLPDAATMPGAYDPWERYNRKMHRFNNAVDRRIARPLARGYVKAVPRPVRLGVSNFFNNLSQPLTMVNSLLQGKGKQAGQSFGRFLLNSTIGIGGLFDPATRANIPQKSEDFGQTLGVWGWKRSRYFELPFFGPRTVRDVFGMAGDAPLSPLRNVEADRVRVPMQGLQLVDVRAQLLSTDALREGAEDDYALVRDAWSQRRDYQIFGDRQRNGEDLPDYLREEDETIVPVDAMPVSVPVPGG